MGKNGYFSEEDILKLKEQEKGGGDGDGGGISCAGLSLIIGLGLIVAGLLYASYMQDKTLTPVVTPFAVAETAVAHLPTPTLAPSATATASATWQPTETAAASATAQATHTPLPTHTPYPTYTPYPSATWTPQATWTPEPTHTAQPTYTPYPTATDEPTAVPVATDVPFLAPLTNQADPPGPRAGGDGPLPGWLPWLLGSLVVLLLTALLVLAYVSHQMRHPAPVMPVPVIPEGGIPIDGTYGRKLPLPTGQPQTSASPTRPMRPMPVEEKRFRGVEPPVQPVEPTSEPVEPVQAVQTTNEGQGVQISLPLPKERPPTAAEAAYIIQRYEELGSITAVCRDVYGSKGGVTFKYVKRAIDGRYSNQPKPKEVKHDPKISPRPDQPTEHRSRRPIPILNKRGRSVLN